MQGLRFRLGLSRMLSAEGKEGAARCNAGVDDAARCVRDVASGSTMEECLLMHASISFRSTRYESSGTVAPHVPGGDGDEQQELEPRGCRRQGGKEGSGREKKCTIQTFHFEKRFKNSKMYCHFFA